MSTTENRAHPQPLALDAGRGGSAAAAALAAPGAPRYWYGERPQVGPVEVLTVLRRYRQAEHATRVQYGAHLGLGETDVLALRHLLQAKQRKEVVRQCEVAAALQITGASASSLVDRLVGHGYVRRTAHPQDRRSVAVETTDELDREAVERCGDVSVRVRDLVDELSDADRAAVLGLLTCLTDAFEADPAR